MIKRKTDSASDAGAPKKVKKQTDKAPKTFEKKTKIPSKNPNKPPKFANNPKKGAESTQKPEDWNEFKKKKKELRLKRRQNRTAFDVIVQSKKIGEKLRCKTLKGGEIERNKLINELHSLLKGQGHYAKFVLAHDTSRVVQWLLKYSSDLVKEQISKELVPVTLEMLQSKYGIFAVKRLLKYGSQSTKAAIVEKMYGQAVKLSSHALSAPIFEFAYTTAASASQKQNLIQEFFGGLFKSGKDAKIGHLRDVFAESPELRQAILGATKANLTRVINKGLLDSTLVQTVLNQYLGECSSEDKSELIPQLVPHIVVISNSKDGARVAMQCIWGGTNKDRKLAMKTIKEHVVELSKHEHGHCTVIALLDAIDDTVLLQKIILGEILKSAKELAVDEWGRKVLLWLVAPSDPTCFHPVFVKELESGRGNSSVKKDPETRRGEILGHSIDTLLQLVAEEPHFWLKNSSLAYEMLAIIKAGRGDGLKMALQSIVRVIIDPNWKVKAKEQEISGIEDAGLHMTLKKLAKNDQKLQDCDFTFGSLLIENLTDEIIADWIVLNRGCFLLVSIFENNEKLQEDMKNMLKKQWKLLKSQNSAGSKIILKKLDE